MREPLFNRTRPGPPNVLPMTQWVTPLTPLAQLPYCIVVQADAEGPAGSQLPGDRGAGIRGVGAVPARPDRGGKMPAQRRVGAGAFGVRRRPAVAAAQPDRPRQLVYQEVHLLPCLGGTDRVVEALRLVQLRLQLLQPRLVGGLGGGVQQLPGVAKVQAYRQLATLGPTP